VVEHPGLLHRHQRRHGERQQPEHRPQPLLHDAADVAPAGPRSEAATDDPVRQVAGEQHQHGTDQTEIAQREALQELIHEGREHRQADEKLVVSRRV
jgi:hypothetical protein